MLYSCQGKILNNFGEPDANQYSVIAVQTAIGTIFYKNFTKMNHFKRKIKNRLQTESTKPPETIMPSVYADKDWKILKIAKITGQVSYSCEKCYF